MLSRLRHISNSSDPHPSKRTKTAAVGQREIIDGRAKAERWFNDTNNNASGTKDVPYLDNDPPFRLHEETISGGDSACAVHSDGSSFNPANIGQSNAPTKSPLAQIEANESNNEDFRGVIDDLTIQNKRLRRKLKQHERLHCSHLQQEKLFEVRMHGLAAHCKRELEEMLRSFASRSEESPETSSFSIENFKASAPALTHDKPPSSSASYSKASKPNDSAYAPMSGQTRVSHKQFQSYSHSDSQDQSHSKQQNVKSHLDNALKTLVPKHSLMMSERARGKLVVRRLELLFTGKRVAGRHYQSYQEHKASAKADKIRREFGAHKSRPIQNGVREASLLPNIADLKVRSLGEANLAAQQSQQIVDSCGQKPLRRGMREARTLLGHAESRIDTPSETNLTGQPSCQITDGKESRSQDPRANCGVTPDQRPTRPVDLDVDGTPIPSDNIECIRHLGLASPTATLDVNTDSDDGWVFLNLLTSMAQLHTLNVTPKFIRHAIADVSSKFELSADGTKVRWQGRIDGAHLSSRGDESDDTEDWESSGTCASVGKPGSLAGIQSRAGLESFQEPKSALPVLTLGLPVGLDAGANRGTAHLEQNHDVDKFQYKPLFAHEAASEDDDSSVHTTSSVSSFDPMGNDTAFNSGSYDFRESQSKLRTQNRENGLIIFYRKAKFCTDLSGNTSSAMHDEAAYCRYTQDPVGCLRHTDGGDLDESESGSDYGPNRIGVPEPMDLDARSTLTACSASDLEGLKSPTLDFSPTPPISLEASGLGGIQPDDNFMVKVQVRHGRRERRGSRPQSPVSGPRSIDTSREAQGISRSQCNRATTKSEIISTVKTHMPPSALPPPSYVCMPFSSSESGDGDDEDEDYSVKYYSQTPRASIKSSVEDPVDSRSANFFLGSSSDESIGSSYASISTGSDDDSSIDFLANARVLDPGIIAACEMDFEISSVQQPVRAGSMAATVRPPSPSSEPLRVTKTESDVDSMYVDGDAEDY